MHKLLENRLVEKYPNLFKNYGGDMTQTCMAWGMSCGRGWFLLLDELCSKLEPYNDIVAAQVKEKFGTLRFYIESTSPEDFDKVHEIISEFEGKSGKICESCGGPGEVKGGSWLKTICNSCEEKQNLIGKIRGKGKYAYAIDEPGHIVVFDPVSEKEIFSGTFSEFMSLVEEHLSLIKDPMSTTEKPLWEQI